jgi:hypothetical protein
MLQRIVLCTVFYAATAGAERANGSYETTECDRFRRHTSLVECEVLMHVTIRRCVY